MALLINNFKHVANTYQLAYACMQCIRAPPTLVCRPKRWLLVVLQAQNSDPTRTRAHRSLKTSDN